MPDRTILWFRRDLRLSDHPALEAAAAGEGEVLGLFVADPLLLAPAGAARRRYLAAALTALDAGMAGRLAVVAGDPIHVVPRVADHLGAARVYATTDFGPYGSRRDEAVSAALDAAGRQIHFVDSPYAVVPGTLRTAAGSPFKVFTPFYRAWTAGGWPGPTGTTTARWIRPPTDLPPLDPAALASYRAEGCDPWPGPVGEAMSHDRLDLFLAGPAASYGERRDHPAADATSGLSSDLKWGTIHPRQILARLGSSRGEEAFARQLAWRDFYADVLHHRPETARLPYHDRLISMEVDEGPQADERFSAWAGGRTGYPIVDAGMRQLLATGWMHNRVRMIVASFLIKDLHIDWTRGARWFMGHLVDGDLASNNHGWQWVAGTGTDASPYFRIFNPVSQGEKFDPGGRYVRTWVPEVVEVADRWVHQPWNDPSGPPPGYPPPMVDHGRERQESLRRYGLATGKPAGG